jgi:putative transposase
VRKNGKEIELPTWRQYAEQDPLDDRTLEQVVLGVSTRGYDRSVEQVPDELGPHGASKSAVSRRFVALTE